MPRRPHRRAAVTNAKIQAWADDPLIRFTLTGFETPRLSPTEERQCRAVYPLLRDQLDEWSWAHAAYGGATPHTREDYIEHCERAMAAAVTRTQSHLAAAIAAKGPLPHGATRGSIERQREARE